MGINCIVHAQLERSKECVCDGPPLKGLVVEKIATSLVVLGYPVDIGR